MGTPHILLVDGNEAELLRMARGLEAEGFSVHTARTADEAEEQTRRVRPDLALVELHVPGTHGLHLARALRRLDASLVVVLTSAFELSGRQIERCDCGATAFVRKPQSPAEVAVALRNALEQANGPSSGTRWYAAANEVEAALA